MPDTPTFAIPYPAGTDPASGPAAYQALAERVEELLARVEALVSDAAAPTPGELIVVNGTSDPVYRAITGDVTFDDGGVAAIGAEKVTSPKLAPNTVTNPKISPAAVTGSKIADGTLTGAKLADAAVTRAKLAAGLIQTKRESTGSIPAGNSAAIEIAFDQAFPDTNYTVIVAVISDTGTSEPHVNRIENKSPVGCVARVKNDAAGLRTGTLQLMAIHD